MNPYIEIYTQLIQYQKINTGAFNFALITYCPDYNRSDVFITDNFKRLRILNDNLTSEKLNHAKQILKEKLTKKPNMVNLYTNDHFGANDWLQNSTKPIINQLDNFVAQPVNNQLLINERYEDVVLNLAERML